MRQLVNILILHLGIFGLTLELTIPVRAFAVEGHDDPISLCADDLMHRAAQNGFYEAMSPGTLSVIQTKKGLASCPDYKVKEVSELLGPVNVPSAVAVYGAADGLREGIWLYQHTAVRTIHLVEVGAHYNDNEISKIFGPDSDLADEKRGQTRGRAVLPVVMVDYNTNVAEWESPERLGVIFWMFAGIMELSHNEKKRAVLRAWKNLDTAGAVVVDVPDTSVNSPSLHVNLEGEDRIRFHFKDPASVAETERVPSLVWSPIKRATGEVDLEKLKGYFTLYNRFRVFKEIQYYSDEPAHERRRLIIFQKTS